MKAKDTCGKRRYATEYDAAKRLKRMIHHAEAVGHKAPLRYYYHASCNGFHLTSRPDHEKETSVRVWYIAPRLLAVQALPGGGTGGTAGDADQDQAPQSRRPARDRRRVGV